MNLLIRGLIAGFLCGMIVAVVLAVVLYLHFKLVTAELEYCKRRLNALLKEAHKNGE